jgi:hypothetical protein
MIIDANLAIDIAQDNSGDVGEMAIYDDPSDLLNHYEISAIT